MKNQSLLQKKIFQVFLTILLILVVVTGLFDLYNTAAGTKNWVGKFTLTWGVFLAGLILISAVAFLIGMLNIWSVRWIIQINLRLIWIRDRLGWICWLLVMVFSLIPAKIFLFTPLGTKFSGVAFRLLIFLTITAVMTYFASRKKGQLVDWNGLLVSLVILGGMFAVGKSFTTVVDHPLSLTWSEGNRMWDYSVLFGRDLYNYPKEQPIEAYIDRPRQTLWGLPFLLPNISILTVRLWSAILFTLPYAILGWMVFRFQPEGKRQWPLLGIWCFLFLNQGPIYTPLILSAILLAVARRKPIWLAFPLIFLAGYYAQSSRISWMFGPAVWAVMIALVDFSPPKNGRISVKNWLNIGSYGLAGFLGGFGIYQGWLRLYNYISRAAKSKGEVVSTPMGGPGIPYVNPNDSLEVLSDIGQNSVLSNQALIWDRLLPNPTYGLGIILGLIIAVGSLILLLYCLVRGGHWRLNLWQKSGIIGGLTFLMGVGILISTKIGGGGDLHNLDMFLVGIVLVTSLAWVSGGYRILANIEQQSIIIKVSIFLAVFIPAFIPWVTAQPLVLPPADKTAWTLELLRGETERIRSEGGEILFMDQRQLLTFGFLGDIPLVPEYEKKLVMDRAMSGDRTYFKGFYKDISGQRFDLIITDPQRIRFSDDDEGWGAENDTWVQWVTKPLLCYYEPVYSVKKTGVWLMMPIAEPGECVYP